MARSSIVLAVVAAVAIAAVVFAAYEVSENPTNQMFGRTVVSGPPNERVVALTYDDGPNPPYTSGILNVLEREHVQATFFVVGRAVAAYPSVVRREVRDGDAVGNHTWDHADLIVLDRTQERASLERTDAAIYRAAGVHVRLMRPPSASAIGGFSTKRASSATRRSCGPSHWLAIGSIRPRRRSRAASYRT